MRRPSIVLLPAVLALGACSAPPAESPSPPVATDPAAETAAATQPSSASPAPSSTDSPAIALELVTDQLSDPINVTGTPEGWLLVNERGGRVVAVHPDTGEIAEAMNLADRVKAGGEQGLLGLALHPEWPDVPRAFIHYSDRATDGDTVISEVSAEPGSAESPPTLDAASEQVLLEEEQPFPNHNGGQIAFGHDGHLYIGLGDGGAGGDPFGHGQNPDTLLGSLLRLDVSTTGEYAIPADNPYAGGGGAPEVFLTGLRNPWRFSFDRDTGLLWIADVGQDAFEEINRLDPTSDGGANLGWNVMEASHCFAGPSCAADGLTLPIAEFGRELGCSVTGGYVYRGEAIPTLGGWYLFSDYCTGFIFGVRADAQPAEGTLETPVILLESGLQVSAFGEGPDGELYVADLEGGALYRVIAAP